MRALTLTQPWASLVALGEKRVETRSWRSAYRGPIAIHAAKGFPRTAREMTERMPFSGTLAAHRLAMPHDVPFIPGSRPLPLGAVVAVATLVDIVPVEDVWRAIAGGDGARYPRFELAFGDYSPGRFGWILTDVRALDMPVPARGALGLWTLPPDAEVTIYAQQDAAVGARS